MPDNAPAPGSADPLDLHGIVPPTVTVFEDDGSLDPGGTAAHARFVVDRGCHGVFPLGTNGEFALLSREERERVVEAVVDEIDEVPVIAGVGEPGTRETIARARHAETAGVDGIVVVTPFYYPCTAGAAVEHYRRVADAVDVPIYVYHIPSKTGNALSRETLGTIAGIDGVAGLKDSSKDIPLFGQVITDNPDLSHLAGSDSLVFPGLEIGCVGCVSAVANAFPEPIVELYEAYDAGEEDRAERLQHDVYELRRKLKEGPYMSGPKAALDIRGFDAGPMRDPLSGMDDDERAALRDVLETNHLTREYV